NTARRDGSNEAVRSEGKDEKGGEGGGTGRSKGKGWNKGEREQLVPIHQEVRELSSRTFYTGDEWDRVWAQKARGLPTGVALVRLVDDARLHEVRVERSAVGYLAWDPQDL